MALELSLESKERPAAPSGAVCSEHQLLKMTSHKHETCRSLQVYISHERKKCLNAARAEKMEALKKRARKTHFPPTHRTDDLFHRNCEASSLTIS